MRSMPGQEEVQQHAKRVHVAHRCDRLAAQLLWTCKFRRQTSRDCKRCIRWLRFHSEQFGNSEVEQAWHALFCDQDVAGLDVAVDHQVLMGVADRCAYCLKELQPCRDIELVTIAI